MCMQFQPVISREAKIVDIVDKVLFELKWMTVTMLLVYCVWALSCMAGYALYDLLNGGAEVGINFDLMFLSMYLMLGWYVINDLKES